jgi:hypothetical protein
MLALAQHYARVRGDNPTDRLLVVFEIDGPIIDLRNAPGQNLFAGLRKPPPSIAQVPGELRPCAGVFEVIRWFQLQSSTFVGLNTSRPETIRAETLRSLNALGRDMRVEFNSALLYMNESGYRSDVVASKMEGLRAFTRGGYRPVAVIDQDPAVIRAMANACAGDDILFLQSRTSPPSPRLTGPRIASGRDFALKALVGKNDLPDRVQLVWHGVNDEVNLREFLCSTVRWGECDVRRDPRQRLVLRHDSFERTPGTEAEPLLTLSTALEAFAGHDRGLKLDLKEGPGILDEVLAFVKEYGFKDDDLWFNASIEALGINGFRQLRSAHPGAVIQCPVDFLAPLAAAAPRQARTVLRTLGGWGISRLSVAWGRDGSRSLAQQLEQWGYEVNLYGVPDHNSFLQAMLQLPRSLTADFNFPEWNYFGRGSGEGQRYHRSRKRRSAAAA